MGSVEHVLSGWADSLETPRADEMGRRGDILRTGHDAVKIAFVKYLHSGWG